MRDFLRVALVVLAVLLLLPSPVTAQIKTGELSTSLNGTVSTGYTADFGNQTSSDHGWTVGGVANVAGYFYNPNFLSYNAGFYLNQSRANSDYQSISDASGINLSSSIFGGSPFPGSVSYSKSFNSDGNYAVPGLADYVTHGDSSTFAVNWSENLPSKPSLSAAFQLGNSSYSVYGTNDQGTNSFHSLNLHSAYNIAGFNMGGYYSDGGGHSLIPAVLSGGDITETQNQNSGEGFNVAHQLPMRGSISAGVNRSTWNTNYEGYTSTGSIDLLNAFASVRPFNKFSLTGSANYSDNLSGQLYQSILQSGAPISGLNTNESSNSLDLLGTLGYSPMANMQTTAYIERRTQLFLGESYGETSYGGSATYSRKLLNGNFNATMNASGNLADANGQDSLGFSTNENYNSRLLGCDVTASFGYSQNVETLLVVYMNSLFHYTGNVRRRWGKLNVNAGAGASRTGITDNPGTVSSTESYNASMGYGSMFTATGSYSKSSGQALVTGAGLVSVPIPSPTLPSNLVTLYGGDGYSFAISSSPARGLTLSASFARANSNTSNSGVASTNQSEELNSLVLYQYRKLNFTSGYSRLEQGFSASGSPPQSVSSYYMGVSRWFNFF